MDYLKIIISIVVAVLGWIIAHYFTSKREIKNKRREIRVEFLIRAYLKLENAIQREFNEISADLESVSADIQLFGTEEQILLVKTILDDLANKGDADLVYLLKSLRYDLRAELQLSHTEEIIQYLRVD